MPTASYTILYIQSLGMDKYFHPTLNRAWDHLSTLGLKLIHLSRRAPGKSMQRKNTYGSGHGTAAVLLPGFAINW